MAKKDFDKFDDKARAITGTQDPIAVGGDELEIVAEPAALAMFTAATNDAELAAAFAGVEMAPSYIKLKENDIIDIQITGRGTSTMAKIDEKTGKPRVLGTWVGKLRNGFRVQFNGAHEIDTLLTPYLERFEKLGEVFFVRIWRGGTERAPSGNNVTRYMVGEVK